jgi:hypothetical protein
MFFSKSEKSLCWIRQPYFFCRQVAKIRQKKKHWYVGHYSFHQEVVS